MNDTSNSANAVRIGTWLSSTDITVVEVLAQAEFDFILVDGEHGHAPVHRIHAIAGAIQHNCRKLVYRVAANRSELIKSALDQGADSVMVPMVNTAEEARQAVMAAKYAPLGNRGIGPLRASAYYRDFDSYLQTANDVTELIVQIETRTALENCQDIAQVPGVGQLYVGPADLAASLGVPLGTLDERMLGAFARVAAAAKANGKAAGIDCSSPSLIPRFREMGFSFFSIGSEIQYLSEGADVMAATCRGLLDREPG